MFEKLLVGLTELALIQFVVIQKTPVMVRMIITDVVPSFELGNHGLC